MLRFHTVEEDTVNTFRIGSAVIAAVALLALSNADVVGAANGSPGTGTKLWSRP